MSETFEGGRALLIGIGEGYAPGMRLPRVVRADAEGVARVLEDESYCGYSPKNVELLLDEHATKANILAGLKRLAATARPDDTVLVFYSGHGARSLEPGSEATYICPADFDPASPVTTGIEAGELSALIKSIQALRVVVVLDACHAGGAVFLKGAKQESKVALGLKNAGLERLAVGQGHVVLSSCTEDEESETYVQKGHSLFTYFLLEGLRGAAIDRGDGLVHVMDLFHFVAEQVPKHASTGHEQHPVIKVNAQDNFALALRAGGSAKRAPAGAPARSKPDLDARQLESVLYTLYPTGPMHNEIWSRAGGDVSQLSQPGNGRAAWHAALRVLWLGGGGPGITPTSLFEAATDEFPNSVELAALRA